MPPCTIYRPPRRSRRRELACLQWFEAHRHWPARRAGHDVRGVRHWRSAGLAVLGQASARFFDPQARPRGSVCGRAGARHRGLRRAVFGRRAFAGRRAEYRRAVVEPGPAFVAGHWREHRLALHRFVAALSRHDAELAHRAPGRRAAGRSARTAGRWSCFLAVRSAADRAGRNAHAIAPLWPCGSGQWPPEFSG